VALSTSRRVIVILGAGGTLGTALSRHLAAEPDTDLVLSDLSEDALRQVSDGIAAGSGAGSAGDVAGEVATVQADISDFAAVENVVRHATDRFGRLDVLISNAGVLSPNGRIHNLTTADWERAYRVNVLGPVNGIRAAVPVMRAQRSGSVILTASVAGLTAWSHSGPYCVTKAGVIELAKVAAVEYARDGIRVNCVCPGTFLSGMHADLPATAVDAIAAKHPLGLGAADDLVGAYSYLASDASRWTTGSAIVVDGGYAAP
jgi:NAD(P)-dependent dehydrogenase (short-subunit alcohol dehydrogenase family)